MGQWHQIFVIVRCPGAPPVDPAPPPKEEEPQAEDAAPPIDAREEREAQQRDTPSDTVRDTAPEKIPAVKDDVITGNEGNQEPQIAGESKPDPPTSATNVITPPFEYVPIACIEHPWMYGLSAVRRLYNILTALSSPRNRPAIIAEINHCRKLGVDGVLNLTTTPCPYISSLIFCNACFEPSIGAASGIRAEKHTIGLNEIWNDNGITVIDMTDVGREGFGIRYAYVDIKPDGMECLIGRLPYLTPMSAGRYLSAHRQKTQRQIDTANMLIDRLEQWEVLDVYTLESAFPGWFVRDFTPRSNDDSDDEIFRDPYDPVKDRREMARFLSLEGEKKDDTSFPTLHLLAVKRMLAAACDDNHDLGWLVNAVRVAPTTLPIVARLVFGEGKHSQDLYNKKGFGRVLATLISGLGGDRQDRYLALTRYTRLTEQNLTELLTSINGIRYDAVNLSNQEHLTDEHISLIPAAFPNVKTFYLISTPKITVSALASLLSSYGDATPPRLVSSTLATPFFLHPDSQFGAFRNRSDIPDPNLILDRKKNGGIAGWNNYTTQIIWKVTRDQSADVCHAALLHPFDTLVGLYNFIAAYANRESSFEHQSQSAGAITGAFGIRARDGVTDYSAFKGQEEGEYDWLEDTGPTAYVRQREDHPQYNIDNMDDALGNGEWRLYIRTQTYEDDPLPKPPKTDNPWRFGEHRLLGRSISVAFFRISPDDDTPVAEFDREEEARRLGIELSPSDGKPFLRRTQENFAAMQGMSMKEQIIYDIKQLEELTAKLEARNKELNKSIADTKKALKEKEKEWRMKNLDIRALRRKKKHEGRGRTRQVEYHNLRSFIDITMGKDSKLGNRIYDAIANYKVKEFREEEFEEALIEYIGGFRWEEMEMYKGIGDEESESEEETDAGSEVEALDKWLEKFDK